MEAAKEAAAMVAVGQVAAEAEVGRVKEAADKGAEAAEKERVAAGKAMGGGWRWG